MEITFESIFMIVTAFVTGVMGFITKNRTVPSKYIPIQNIIIGAIAAIIAISCDVFDNYTEAILISLATSLGVGGGYDVYKKDIKK
ncbi:MAG: hypothetical protein J6T15_05210 [Bacilli bacterium]|nr:hypothetical protein [Bacilli bacterium]